MLAGVEREAAPAVRPGTRTTGPRGCAAGGHGRRARRRPRSTSRRSITRSVLAPTSSSDSPRSMVAVQIDQSGSARPQVGRCVCPRTRRSPTRRGRRAPSARSPSPASSHVRRARCNGLVSTRRVVDVRRSPARTGAEQAGARRSPSALSGMSVRPVWRRSTVHSVSPWRMRTAWSATGEDSSLRSAGGGVAANRRTLCVESPRAQGPASNSRRSDAASWSARACRPRRRGRGLPSSSSMTPRRGPGADRRPRCTETWSARRPVVVELARRSGDVQGARVDQRRRVVAHARHRAVVRPPALPGMGEQLRRPRRCAGVVVVGQGVTAPRRELGCRTVRRRPATCALADGTTAWIDGGPRRPWDAGSFEGAVIHSESVDAGAAVPAPPANAPKADLAPDQLESVSHTSGAARIIAPAGSGKTRVLTERLRHLVVDRGYDTRAVLAVAYNKQAQLEMESRTADFRPHVRTLNSLGLWVLAQHRGSSPAVIDEREARSLVDSLLPGNRRRRANTDPIGPYLEGLAAIRLGLRDPDEVETSRDDVDGLTEIFPRVPGEARRARRGRLRRADLQRDRDPARRRRLPPGHAAVVPPPSRRRVPGPHAGPRADDPPAQPARPRRLRRGRRRPVHLRARRRRPFVPDRLRRAVSRRRGARPARELPLPGRRRRPVRPRCSATTCGGSPRRSCPDRRTMRHQARCAWSRHGPDEAATATVDAVTAWLAEPEVAPASIAVLVSRELVAARPARGAPRRRHPTAFGAHP